MGQFLGFKANNLTPKTSAAPALLGLNLSAVIRLYNSNRCPSSETYFFCFSIPTKSKVSKGYNSRYFDIATTKSKSALRLGCFPFPPSSSLQPGASLPNMALINFRLCQQAIQKAARVSSSTNGLTPGFALQRTV
jgi:hypothetical protein